MTSIFRILEEDHRRAENLLARLAIPASQADFDTEGRQSLVDALVAALSRHEACEELVFWPQVRKRVAGGDALADRALTEEREGRTALDILRLARTDEEIIRDAATLTALVATHVRTEEAEVWPLLRRTVTRVGAAVMGFQYRLAWRWATPTRPHPKGPDRPVGLLTRGALAVVSDRVRDRFAHRPATRDRSTASDPVAVIKGDHADIRAGLRRSRRSAGPDRPALDDLVRRMSVHDSIEREHLYPRLRTRVEAGEDHYDDGLEAHGEMARLLTEVERTDDPHRLDQLLDQVATLFSDHADYEERRLLPALTRHLSDAELADLGAELEAAKSKAPTRPHPHLAGAGTGEKLLRLVEAPIDRTKDRLSGRRAR